MKLNLGQGLVVVGLAMGLAACGPKLQSVAEQDGSNTADPSRRETVKVGISLSEKGSGMRLADATTFSMSLDGCASGLNYPSITENDVTVDLYKFDQGCLIKLNSFSLNSVNYVLSADTFESWTAGDIAIFQDSANTNNKLTVRVVTQLPTAIAGSETVSYSYTQLVAGADESIAKSVVSDTHTVSVNGVDAAKVEITSVNMTGMTAQGAGRFTFDVLCLQGVSSGSCDTNPLTSLKYMLVKDTYSNNPTYEQLNTLFSTGGTAVAAGDIIATGNGGFKTQVMSTPDEMALPGNSNLLFIVQSGGSSYKYFNVDVAALTY
ncbi:MAG TPA: hypothetical protein VFO10_06900 [Oligoflexus sp.]|uniref:hypothetical protein n=1 Tax=Oligoflexus sp. TaxID=1971216 RepID=UPI002D80D970|nr:hypothetical protein [Oligoflexus sp.]HET9236960.1 hypothetical protein [Oligoflexus sp.]